MVNVVLAAVSSKAHPGKTFLHARNRGCNNAPVGSNVGGLSDCRRIEVEYDIDRRRQAKRAVSSAISNVGMQQNTCGLLVRQRVSPKPPVWNNFHVSLVNNQLQTSRELTMRHLTLSFLPGESLDH